MRIDSLGRQVLTTPPEQQGLLSEALEELRTALEELRAAEEEMRQQNSELAELERSLEAERRRYQDLFEFTPDAYLVTDEKGLITEANRAAGTLLKVPSKFAVGTPLAVFIAEEGRRAFRSQLRNLAEVDQVKEWEVRMRPPGRGGGV